MAFTYAGGNVRTQRAPGGRPDPRALPPVRFGQSGSNPAPMGASSAAGVIRPGSPQDENLTRQVMAAYGRTDDLPQDDQFSGWLRQIGWGNAHPGSFPETELRRRIRRGSLETAAGQFGGGGGSNLNLPPSQGAGDGMSGPGGSAGLAGGALPPRVDVTGPLMGFANKTQPRESLPTRLAPAGPAPSRVPGIDTGGLDLPSMKMPTFEGDPLMERALAAMKQRPMEPGRGKGPRLAGARY